MTTSTSKTRKMFYTVAEILGHPTHKNYFFSTQAHFEVVEDDIQKVADAWNTMKANSGMELHISPKSGSEYLLDTETGDIYRMSSHWGKVATCEWTTANHKAAICYRHYCIARCNINDFSFIGKVLYLYCDKIRNQYA